MVEQMIETPGPSMNTEINNRNSTKKDTTGGTSSARSHRIGEGFGVNDLLDTAAFAKPMDETKSNYAEINDPIVPINDGTKYQMITKTDAVGAALQVRK